MMGKRTTAGWRCALAPCAAMIALMTWTEPAYAETYVILSVVGDHVTMVRQRGQTGSHIDVNEYEVMPVASSGLDDYAARTADGVLAKIRPNAGSVTVRANPSALKIGEAWLDADVRGSPRCSPISKSNCRPCPRRICSLSLPIETSLIC